MTEDWLVLAYKLSGEGGGLPSVDNPTAFWTFTALLVVMMVVQVVVFKWRKWF